MVEHQMIRKGKTIKLYKTVKLYDKLEAIQSRKAWIMNK